MPKNQGRSIFVHDIFLKCADLDPVNEESDLLPHRLGLLSRHHVVILGRVEPVHHDDVGRLLPLVQRRHQLGHPALEHAAQLRKKTQQTTRELNFGSGKTNADILSSSAKGSGATTEPVRIHSISKQLGRVFSCRPSRSTGVVFSSA